MAGNFSLALGPGERAFLLAGAREAIMDVLEGRGRTPARKPGGPEGALREPAGAFVTLKLDGQLRGCIGTMTAHAPLYETVWQMARAAAFEDPRFLPLTAAEAGRLAIEISVLSPLARCADPEAIRVGRDGLLLRKGARQGVFLPQVPVEWNWSREAYLEHLCRKAGLPPGAWKDPGAELFTFEALVFGGEKDDLPGSR